MMSPRSTGSPVSASTGFSEMRLPVFGLIWLSLIRSASLVAGASEIGQVTSETRRWPDQLGRGMTALFFVFRLNQCPEVPRSQRVVGSPVREHPEHRWRSTRNSGKGIGTHHRTGFR